MTSYRKKRQPIELVYILFSLRWNVEFILQSRTLLVTTGTLENSGKNLPCNVEDNLHAGLIVIEAWFGGY